ncbi:MAG: CHAT domain-containing protein [Lyngbya sp. HA4199-MV5]|jgi:filamentous hemagglutinin family protein|nr:CHAT domain-containing protein [Lyngbya sp. HA4199-MV5]
MESYGFLLALQDYEDPLARNSAGTLKPQSRQDQTIRHLSLLIAALSLMEGMTGKATHAYSAAATRSTETLATPPVPAIERPVEGEKSPEQPPEKPGDGSDRAEAQALQALNASPVRTASAQQNRTVTPSEPPSNAPLTPVAATESKAPGEAVSESLAKMPPVVPIQVKEDVRQLSPTSSATNEATDDRVSKASAQASGAASPMSSSLATTASTTVPTPVLEAPQEQVTPQPSIAKISPEPQTLERDRLPAPVAITREDTPPSKPASASKAVLESSILESSIAALAAVDEAKEAAPIASTVPPQPILLAQAIVPAADGTGTRVKLDGNRFDIDGGTLSGDRANLFHSFQRLGLNADQIANFMSNPNIRNILGRVVGGDASVINGLVQVTGGNSNLFLMNPAGIVFGANARLDVPGSFTATTANGMKFGDQWFSATGSNNYGALVGNPNAFAFTMNQPGTIVNAGDLAVAEGKQLALVGGAVVNTGKLSAPGGQITIAAVPGGKQVQINQDGVLLALRVQPLSGNSPNPLPFTPSTLPALLTGGTNRPATGVVVNSDGTVQLTDGGTTIPTSAGTAIAAGSLDVSGQAGGNVGVFGDRVGVINSTINASGTNGGGTVLIGGDYQGKGALPNAQNTVVSQDSIVRADALTNGNGGKVVVWSDGDTRVGGTMTAKGGTQSGNGGLVETSGKQFLTIDQTATVNTTAPQGKTGTWLLDPADLTVVASGGTGTITGGNNSTADSTINNSTIVTALNSSQVNLSATNAITVSAPINASGNTNANALTFTASTISINQSLTLKGDLTITGTGTINTGAVTTPGRAVNITGSNINVGTIDTSINAIGSSTNGGAITLQSNGGSIKTGSLITQIANGSGAAGNITLNVASGTGSIDTSSGTLNAFGINGSGGNVSLATQSGNITTADITTFSNTVVAGSKGGDVTLRVNGGNGNVDTTRGEINTVGNNNGPGGSIALTTASGNITTANLTSRSRLGNGGNMTLQATGTGSINTSAGTVDSSSFDTAPFRGNGGAITLTTNGGSVTTSTLTSVSNTGGRGGDISITGTTTTAGAIATESGDITLTADEINLQGALTGTNNLLLQPLSPSQPIALGGTADIGTGTLDLLFSDLTALQNGFSSITIGRSNSSGAITLAGNVTFNDPVALRSPTGSINVNAPVIADNLTLSAPTANLNQPITLRTNSTLSGTATTVNVGATGGVQNGVDVAATGGTVNLAAATYVLANTVNIAKSLTLNGINAANTTVSGNNAVQVFNVSGAGTVVNLNNLTITQGNTLNGGGGGIHNEDATLTVNNSTISNNTATGRGGTLDGGGGIHNKNATLTVNNSTISNNTVNGASGGGGTGGGILINGGTVTVNNSTISNNTATGAAGGVGGNGGGIANGSIGGVGNGSTLVVSNSTFSNNIALTGNGSLGSGGGIFNSGTLTITDSTFRGNSATGGGVVNGGGGIYNSGTATVTDSSLSGNLAVGSGNGIYKDGGTLSLSNSSLDDVITNIGGTTTLSGNITTTGQQTYGNAVTLGSNTTLRGALVAFNSTLDGVRTLSIGSNSVFNGAVGNRIRLTDLTISGTTALNGGSITTIGTQQYSDAVTVVGNTSLSGSNIAFNRTVNAGSNALTLTADGINLGGTVSGTGNLTLQPLTPTRSIALGNPTDSGTSTLDLTSNDLGNLQNGFSSITIGRSDGLGAINVAENTVFSNPTTLRTPGGDIFLQGSVTLQNNASLNFDSLSVTNTLSQDITNTTSTPLNFYGRVLLGNDITISSASDIRFTNTLDGDRRLNLNASAVRFDGLVGGSTPLRELTINSQTTDVAGSITTTGDSQFNSAVSVANNAGITSKQGSIRATGTITSAGNSLLNAVNLMAAGDIAIQDAIANAGIISLTSGAAVTSRNLTAAGGVAVRARNSITTGAIDTANAQGNGGNVLLDPQGDIQVDSINAQGDANSAGGTVDITTARFFRALGTFRDRNGILASISTAGGVGGGSITIRNGGGFTRTPFVIGNAAQNGTAGAITTGTFTLTPVQSLLRSFNEGGIQIISTATDDFTRNLVEPQQQGDKTESVETRAKRSADDLLTVVSLIAIDKGNAAQSVATLEATTTAEYEKYWGLKKEDATVTTLSDVNNTLSRIEAAVGVKPAIVYISFAPTGDEPQTPLLQRSALSKSRDQLELILVTASGQAIRKTVPGATRLRVQLLANQFRRAVTSPFRRRTVAPLLEPSQQLYQLLIAPLEPELKQQKIQNLTFILDSGLRSLPLAALYDAQTRSFLVEKYSLGLMPTLSLTDTRYVDVRNSQVLAMGASQFAAAQAQGSLPAVPLELELVGAQWKAKTLSEKDFTLTNLRQQPPFGIVHLATHASFQQGPPSNSYIQFEDTTLKLNQLRSLNWSDQPPELVVLSACRTAFGSEDAELGFAGSAVQARVKSVLASLWSVNDTGASGLMAEFYHQLKTAPIKAEALKQAQIAMLRGDVYIKDGKLHWSGGEKVLPPGLTGLENGNLSHPYYWSAFTLVGSPW